MQYRKLGLSDLTVSAVGMGTWAIGGDYFGAVEESSCISAIRSGVEKGITLVDTAPAYGDGQAEIVVGKALKGIRDQVVLCTKVGVLRENGAFVRCLKRESMLKEIDASLKRLDTDVIDLYQIHWPDQNTPMEEALETLHQIKQSGKVRYVGVSNFSPAQMAQAIAAVGIVSCQPPYSLLERKAEAEILPFCLKNGLGTLTYGSLHGGLLTGRYDQPLNSAGADHRSEFYPYFREPLWTKCQPLLTLLREIAKEHGSTPAQIAIAWTIAQPGVTCALVGATKPYQAEANAQAADVRLSADELRRIAEA